MTFEAPMGEVSIPTGYDLLGFEVDGVHKLMAVCEEWCGTAVPYKDAATPICLELCAKRPQDFPNNRAAEMWFLWTHMRNFRLKQDLSGHPYPK